MSNGRLYTDRLTLNGVDFYAVTVDPNGSLDAAIGSIATLKTAAFVWVCAGGMVWNLVYPVAVPPGPSTQSFLWGNELVGSSVTPRYLTPGYDDVLAPVEDAIVQFRTNRAGTLQNLRVRQNAPDGNGNPITYTVRVNGVPTLIQATLLSTASDGSDLVNTVLVAPGSLVDVEVTKALTVGSSPRRVTAEVDLA